MSRNIDSPEWIRGAAVFWAGVGLLGLQGYWYLRDGAWSPLSFMDALRYATNGGGTGEVKKGYEWLVELLAFLPVPGTLIAIGFLVMLLAHVED